MKPRPTAPLAPRVDGGGWKPLTLADLAAHSPTVQKNMIGERLYRIIQGALREHTAASGGLSKAPRDDEESKTRDEEGGQGEATK